MEEIKHTPGPWEAVIVDIGMHKVFTRNAYNWRNDLAEVYACTDEGKEQKERAIKDTYLISAAPELFSLIEEVKSLPVLQTTQFDDLRKRITLTIAKAKGIIK